MSKKKVTKKKKSPTTKAKRGVGRPRKQNPDLVRNVRVEFLLTESEQDDLNERAEEAREKDPRLQSRAIFIRKKLGFPIEPEESEPPL